MLEPAQAVDIIGIQQMALPGVDLPAAIQAVATAASGEVVLSWLQVARVWGDVSSPGVPEDPLSIDACQMGYHFPCFVSALRREPSQGRASCRWLNVDLDLVRHLHVTHSLVTFPAG